jgi:GT2 family glycosyltransferase
MQPSTALTAVVVSRGLDALLSVCLSSLRRALFRAMPDANFNVVVIDNASEFPYDPDTFAENGYRLIRFDTHQGFAKANNAGFRRYPSPFHLLLNNDVLLGELSIQHMLRLLVKTPSAGICGTRLLFPDGSIQHCGVVFGDRETGPYHVNRKRRGDLVPRVDGEYQAVTGACMLVRGELWGELDGLCEDYEFGLEDIDFCLRSRARGWRVVCSNATDSLHFESSTPGRAELDRTSRKLFMQRWRHHYTIDG